MPKPTDPEVWLYALAGTVDYALNALDDGTLTADEALMFIRKARREYMDAAQADASAAVAAAEVPDELAEHRVVIRLDGGDYQVRCTGGDLTGRAPTLKAAERTKAKHEGSHR